MNTIINEPFTVPLDRLPYPVEVRELSPGPYKLPFALDCRFLVHASPCLGYRFDLDGKIITYCPDTGVCENAVLLAADADLLIAECAHLPGEAEPGVAAPQSGGCRSHRPAGEGQTARPHPLRCGTVHEPADAPGGCGDGTGLSGDRGGRG